MNSVSKSALWTGRVLTLLAAIPFIMSSCMKFANTPQIVQGMAHYGWPQSSLITIAILEMAFVLLYLIPPFSVLGAVLLTGFLGGTMATVMRLGEPVYFQVAIGFLIWGGLFLRDPRLRVLLPVVGKDCTFKREVTINRPVGEVFTYIKSLKNFQNWNPFLKADSQVELKYHGTDGTQGAQVAWSGNRQVGAGEQEITRVLDGECVDFDLRFKRPFQNTTTGSFKTSPGDNGTTIVTWSMEGKALFPMTVFGLFLNTDKMIGGQFEAGLRDLKGILERA